MEHEHAPREHCHPHGLHDHSPRLVERKKLLWSMALTGTMMGVEAIGGFLTNSLALLSDAGHMLTHFSALLISLGATLLATRALPSKERSFGFYRVEVLAALLNSIILFVICFFIFNEAFRRIHDPQPIKGAQMFVVAVIGLMVNLVTAGILSGVRANINLRSAFFHMLGDTLSSFGVVAGAIWIHFTKKTIVDPLLSILIAVLILIWSVRLLRDACHILLESSPRHIQVDEVIRSIRESIKEVRGLHDVHIWEITSNMYAMTAHAIVEDMKISESSAIRNRIHRLLEDRFDIGHTNIQFELREEGKTVQGVTR